MLSVAATHENTTMSYSVNTTSTLVVMVGATVSIVTLELLEFDAALELVVDIEDVLDWLDDI
jgi:hypothetical protein